MILRSQSIQTIILKKIEIYDKLTKDEYKAILVERGLMKFIEYFRQNKQIETIYKKQILALYHELNTEYQYYVA